MIFATAFRQTVLIALSAAAALSIVVAAPALAASVNWTPVAWGGKAGNMQLYFVNRADIVRDGDRLEVEVLAISEVPTKRSAERVIERSVVTCSTMSSVAIDVRTFDGKGRQLDRFVGDGKVERYVEGSAWWNVIDTVCQGTFPPQTTTSPAAYAEAFFKS